MSLYITSLNSGSNGNCYYIGNGHEAVLIDAGISCRETEKRMRRLGLSMDIVKAVFISHEHGDHIRGVESIAVKYQIPIYITATTLRYSKLRISAAQAIPFSAYEPVSIGGLSVLAFPKLHDASDPHSFVVTGNGVNIGVFTDIGSPCRHVTENFKLCHAIFLEANYDDAMLEQGRYPYHLKKRISGSHGHLSNMQALELYLAHRPAHMSHILLSHLSKDNNTPQLAYNQFSNHPGNKAEIIIASRDEESAVYHITGNRLTPAIRIKKQKQVAHSLQMSLF